MSAYASVLASIGNSAANKQPKFNQATADSMPNGTAVYLESPDIKMQILFWAIGENYSHVIFKEGGKWHDAHWDAKSGEFTSKSIYFHDNIADRRYIAIQSSFNTNSIGYWAGKGYATPNSGFQVCTVYAARASNGTLWGLGPGQQAYNQIGYRPGIDGYYRGRP